MPLDNAQAEFGIRAFLEGPSDGVGDERTVASENRTFYDEVSAVTLPALSPRVQTLQGFVSIEEVVGYDVTRFTFTVSTFRPELVRNAGKDDIIIATDAEGTVGRTRSALLPAVGTAQRRLGRTDAQDSSVRRGPVMRSCRSSSRARAWLAAAASWSTRHVPRLVSGTWVRLPRATTPISHP